MNSTTYTLIHPCYSSFTSNSQSFVVSECLCDIDIHVSRVIGIRIYLLPYVELYGKLTAVLVYQTRYIYIHTYIYIYIYK